MREIRSGLRLPLMRRVSYFLIYWVMWWFIGRILGLVLGELRLDTSVGCKFECWLWLRAWWGTNLYVDGPCNAGGEYSSIFMTRLGWLWCGGIQIPGSNASARFMNEYRIQCLCPADLLTIVMCVFLQCPFCDNEARHREHPVCGTCFLVTSCVVYKFAGVWFWMCHTL